MFRTKYLKSNASGKVSSQLLNRSFSQNLHWGIKCKTLALPDPALVVLYTGLLLGE